MKIKILFVYVYLLIFTDLCYAGWAVQTVDSAGDGWYTSIAVDSSGNPHIAYSYYGTNYDLKYASWTGTSWSIQTVDSAGSVGSYTSIALDTSNRPHISYRDETNLHLKYAKWTGTSWSIQTVDSLFNVGGYTSIAVDSSGNPHISYYDFTNYDLKYASWTGTGWSIKTVNAAGDVGQDTSIALDTSNNPHISYHRNYDLKYARWTNNPVLSWTGETNYTSDGLDPETGTSTNTYIYRVKYTDADNDAPASGYPKLYIKKGGTNITGSPFTMTSVDPADTTYTDGKLYTYSTTLSTGTDYTYYFEAYDIWNASATGTPTTPIDAPDVSVPVVPVNTAPILLWTGETNYVSDGLNPETGDASTTFVYRVKYTDVDNDAPKSGYPKLYIKKGGINISSSPFAMLDVDTGDTTYTGGKLYTYSTTLSTGTDYTYYFEAYDVYGASATGMPTIKVDAPDIPSIEIQQFKLYNNLFDPNKNEKVTITYNLQEDTDVKITIHDITGTEIRKIVDERKSAGFYTAEWAGLNTDNEVVASGLYIVYIQAGSYKDKKKVLVVK